jgi:hypothetical protein
MAWKPQSKMEGGWAFRDCIGEITDAFFCCAGVLSFDALGAFCQLWLLESYNSSSRSFALHSHDEK